MNSRPTGHTEKDAQLNKCKQLGRPTILGMPPQDSWRRNELGGRVNSQVIQHLPRTHKRCFGMYRTSLYDIHLYYLFIYLIYYRHRKPTGWLKKVSHFQVSSLNRIKNRH